MQSKSLDGESLRYLSIQASSKSSIQVLERLSICTAEYRSLKIRTHNIRLLKK